MNPATHAIATMKCLLAVFTIAIANVALGAPPDIAERYEFSNADEIFDLSANKAKEQGSRLAKSDFEKGIYRISVFGLYKGESPSEIYLRKKYEIYWAPIAGCMVSDGIIHFANAYNATMKSLLAEHFKKDVFAEAEKVTAPMPE